MLEQNLIELHQPYKPKPNLGLRSLLCKSVLRSTMQFVTNMLRTKQGQDGSVSVLTRMVNVEFRHSKVLYQSELHVTGS